MPADQIKTFSDIDGAWRSAERESDKRAVWRALARGGWFHACRDAVQRNDQTTLKAWLDAGDSTRQDILHFAGPEATQLVHAYLRCGLVGCSAREEALQEILNHEPGALTFDMPLGFCTDLTLALAGQPLRQAEQNISLSVLLVDTARNEGVGATLLLELISGGRGECYATPELAFLRDTDARQAEDNARACVARTGLWQTAWDVRWQLHRNDGKPLVTLSGPSLGAAFALGLANLCAARL